MKAQTAPSVNRTVTHRGSSELHLCLADSRDFTISLVNLLQCPATILAIHSGFGFLNYIKPEPPCCDFAWPCKEEFGSVTLASDLHIAVVRSPRCWSAPA